MECLKVGYFTGAKRHPMRGKAAGTTAARRMRGQRKVFPSDILRRTCRVMSEPVQTTNMSWWNVPLPERMAELRARESQVFLVLSVVIGAVTGLAVVAFILLTERLGM